jgi:hypothetical protein
VSSTKDLSSDREADEGENILQRNDQNQIKRSEYSSSNNKAQNVN